MDTNYFVQDGFIFFTEEESQQAALEIRKVEYLESKMDYSKPETILQIYEKAIKDRVFHTQVGIFYLKKLQDFLLSNPEIDSSSVSAIPAYDRIESGLRRRTVQNHPKQKPEKEKGNGLRISIILNIALVIAVIAMFVIALNAQAPNILNYEQALQDKYSSWEQELSEREQNIRAKELELHLQQENL